MKNLIKKLLKELKKENIHCKEFHPGCGACHRYLLIGLLEDLLADLEFEETTK